ncbi:glycosyltransferase family 2 protein [Ignavibacteria bacterium]|jgi:dolichol-phosphate mannosyltransferase|nr:glycosyltransferase [Bacteroidota bacterium]MCZ2133019.1 glycosyltransferase family 2 protein [Bacteroidota bacterium]
MKISVVVPMYNEEGIVQRFFERIEDTRKIFAERFAVERGDFEIIFVNDGSRDGTLEMLKKICRENIGYILLNLSRNHGHQTAITAGIDAAQGAAVAVIDGDLQDPPEFIADMYGKMLEGYDVVYAVRKKREGETFFKLFTAKLFYRTLKKLTNVAIPVDTGDFRIMSRRVVNVFCSLRERHRFIRGMVSWVGFPQTGLEYERHERFAGTTKYTLSRMLKFAADGITSFSAVPLKSASYMGIFTALGGFLYALYIIYLRLFTNIPIQGWSSIIVVVLILGGVQLLALGMIGEYLGRVHDETKFRPLYIAENFYDSEHPNGFIPTEYYYRNKL